MGRIQDWNIRGEKVIAKFVGFEIVFGRDYQENIDWEIDIVYCKSWWRGL